jgi:hypothetical protein
MTAHRSTAVSFVHVIKVCVVPEPSVVGAKTTDLKFVRSLVD